MPTPYAPPSIEFEDVSTVLRYKSDEELRAANFVLWIIGRPAMLRTGRFFARMGLALRVPGTVAALRGTVFRQFCGGTSLQEALATASRLHEHGIGTILDYAAEVGGSEAAFDSACDEIGRVIDSTADQPGVPFVAIKVTALARFALLEKMSTGTVLEGEELDEKERVVGRLERLASRADAAGISIFVDAEHSWIQVAIDEMCADLMLRYNRERAVVHTTVQLYLRNGLELLADAIADARSRGYRLGVKLVRGAYMEQENERAADRGYDSPVQPSKEATDADYDRATTMCLDNLDAVDVSIATHNVPSTRHLISEMARRGIAADDPRVSASQLLGMLDRITFPLARLGYNALKYMPYGRVREALPYLLRRADENRSVAEQLGAELDAVRQELERRGLRAL